MRTIGEEFRISDGAMGSVLRSPEPVLAPDGKVLLVSYGMSADAFGIAVRVTRTDPATGDSEVLFVTSAADLGFPEINRGMAGADIAVRTDGSFAIAFTAYDIRIGGGTTTANSALYVQTFAPDGSTIGTPQEIARWAPGAGGNVARNTRIEAVDDGYVMTATMEVLINRSVETQQLLYRLDAGGQSLSTPVVLENSGTADILAMQDGGALLAWINRGTIYTKRIEDNGTIDPARTLPAQALGFSHAAANLVELRQLSDGRIFALYQGPAAFRPEDPPGGLYLQELDTLGRAVGTPRLVVPSATPAGDILLSPAGSNTRAGFDLAELPDGQLVVAYAFSPASGTRDYDIGLVLLAPDGTAQQDSPSLLTANRLREQGMPYLLQGTDGTLLLAFYDERPPALGGRNEMRAVAIDAPLPSDETLRGDAGDNTLIGAAGNDDIAGAGGNDLLRGGRGADRLDGGEGNDTLYGGDGTDTLIGGTGDDLIFGGDSADDLRDVIYGGDGNDTAYGGAGNDEIRGDAGNDLLFGDTGADTLIGGAGNDTLNGGSLGDMLMGGDGDDFLNGGFGFDRLNGGAGADTFFHLGVFDHGSDWIQDYNAAEGDVLQFGNTQATRAQFQINQAFTPNAGSADVAEAFVIYRPTGQIIWALVDGAGQDSINLRIGGEVFDLMLPG